MKPIVLAGILASLIAPASLASETDPRGSVPPNAARDGRTSSLRARVRTASITGVSQSPLAREQSTAATAAVPLPPPRPGNLGDDAGAAVCPPTKLSRDDVRALVVRIAAEEQFDPRLAEAVARAESDWGKQLVSPKGAVGLMQLMPSTGAAYGVTDRCDPESNVRAGIRYLKDLLSEFDSPILALAAYNAGPKRVYEHGGVPVFHETATYIIRVLNHWLDLDAQVARSRDRRRDPAGTDHRRTASLPSPSVGSQPASAWVDGHVFNLKD